MRPADRFSKPYDPTGNISANGITKILGAPNHDRLRILIRETVQNSWDARRQLPVDFQVRLRTLSDGERAFLRESIFADLPPGLGDFNQVDRCLFRKKLRLLEISDSGTYGLSGPIRASDIQSGPEPENFIQFVRNIGVPRDQKYGGGTYGFGKSASYVMSACHTILIHTLTTDGGAESERFITARLGQEYTVEFGEDRGRYTGRHWWGRMVDGVLDPICGNEARDFAAGTGLLDRSGGQFGTTIAVLAPDLDGRTPDQVINTVQETLLWFLWPKMVDLDGSGPVMRFRTWIEDQEIRIPEPEEFPPLDIFVEAYRNLKLDRKVIPISRQRPETHLGKLSIAKGVRIERTNLDTGDNQEIVPEVSSHVALMRPVSELVVNYLEGPSLPHEMREYGGVFICDRTMEKDFAASEPPAHDDWIPENLPKDRRTFVRVALRRIRENQARVAGVNERPAKIDDDRTAVGALGDALGGLLTGVKGSGPGGEKRSGGGGGGSRRRKIRVTRPEPAGLETLDGVPCARFDIEVQGGQGKEVRLEAQPQVVIEGGLIPAEDFGVEVMAWSRVSDEQEAGPVARIGFGPKISLRPESNKIRLRVSVAIPDEAAILLDVVNRTIEE